MDFGFIFYYACLKVRFLDVETNPGLELLDVVPTCKILYSNVRGLYGNLNDLSVTASSYDLVLCSETLVPDHRHSSELAVPYFGALHWDCTIQLFEVPVSLLYMWEMVGVRLGRGYSSVGVSNWWCWRSAALSKMFIFFQFTAVLV